MLEHETLFGTVSRTLRDDYKKSIELSLYLLNIFQAYSNFTQFHEFFPNKEHIVHNTLWPYIDGGLSISRAAISRAAVHEGVKRASSHPILF